MEKGTFKSNLEHFLPKYRLYIGPKGELFFIAVVLSLQGEQVAVAESQNGIEHLLLLVEIYLTDDDERVKEIMEERDKQYSYPKGALNVNDYERFLQDTAVELFYRDGKLCMDCFQIKTPSEMKKDRNPNDPAPIPGVYYTEVTGTLITELFDLALQSPFKRIAHEISM